MAYDASPVKTAGSSKSRLYDGCVERRPKAVAYDGRAVAKSLKPATILKRAVRS
jgi:hypothetical protein